MLTYHKDRWDEWMAAALQGDKEAYRSLLHELRPWLLRYYQKRVQGGAADDLVQETLLSLHNKRHTFIPGNPFLPWLSAIARHRWIDYMRSLARQNETELLEDLPAEGMGEGGLARKDLQVLLSQLPAAQAEAIALVRVEGLTIAEVARKTGYSTANVKVMIHRGMKRMAHAVKEGRDDDEQ